MNDYFVNITENLDISCANIEDSLNEDPYSRIIEHFESHSSILKIKGSISSTIKLFFRKVTVEEMLEKLNYLDPKKPSPQESIPPKILKTNADMLCFPLVELFNKIIEEGIFPNNLKCADVYSQII